MKQLKGKAREDFIAYIEKRFPHMDIYLLKYIGHSFIFGVIQDFFDSVGICVDVFRMGEFYAYSSIGNIYNGEEFKTRKKARKQAIKLATKHYNEYSELNRVTASETPTIIKIK